MHCNVIVDCHLLSHMIMNYENIVKLREFVLRIDDFYTDLASVIIVFATTYYLI